MSLLFGGLITLVVTALVQIIIIPLVQRRNRRLERWEKDMVELDELLHSELPAAALRVEAKTNPDRFFERRFQDDPATLESIITDFHSSIQKTERLGRRVGLMGRRSPYWIALQHLLSYIALESGNMVAWAQFNKQPPNIEKWWHLHRSHIKDAADILNLVFDDMRPPPAFFGKSVAQRAEAMADKSIGRKQPHPIPPPAE
jgi:hypothetical protein